MLQISESLHFNFTLFFFFFFILIFLGKELDSNKHACLTVDCKGPNWFQCSSGCIPSSYRCDGIDDCSGGQDEMNCTAPAPAETTCSSNQFRCNSGSCIERDYVCDGELDCRDESDEPARCPPAACNPDEFDNSRRNTVDRMARKRKRKKIKGREIY